jgi:hypothetical protein
MQAILVSPMHRWPTSFHLVSQSYQFLVMSMNYKDLHYIFVSRHPPPLSL